MPPDTDTEMIERRFTVDVRDPMGLHLRPSGHVLELATRCTREGIDLTIAVGERSVSAASMLDMMTIPRFVKELTFVARGTRAALERIFRVGNDLFGLPLPESVSHCVNGFCDGLME